MGSMPEWANSRAFAVRIVHLGVAGAGLDCARRVEANASTMSMTAEKDLFMSALVASRAREFKCRLHSRFLALAAFLHSAT